MATLQLEGVRKSFGTVDVIHDMTLNVHDGELIVFVGPSGCGKSTMLRMIAGLETLSAGEIRIGERRVDELPPKDRGIAMVFQSYALYPHKDVRGNLGFALKHAGVDRAEIDRRVDEASSILGLSGMMTRKPRELSGGQRQRVAIGRAIVREPDVFLFDEPLSNLDAALRVHMRVEILKLHQRLKNTMVYVTHDQVEAMTLADRIVVFREGRVEQIGTPLELYRKPVNTFVARFIGSPSMNLLNGQARDGIVSLQGEPVCRVPLVGGPLSLGVRPEHLVVLDVPGNRTTRDGESVIALPDGRVQVFEHLGGESYAHVLLEGGQELVAKLDGEFDLAIDQPIALGVPSSKLHLFETGGARIAIDPA